MGKLPFSPQSPERASYAISSRGFSFIFHKGLFINFPSQNFYLTDTRVISRISQTHRVPFPLMLVGRVDGSGRCSRRVPPLPIPDLAKEWQDGHMRLMEKSLSFVLIPWPWRPVSTRVGRGDNGQPPRTLPGVPHSWQ